jgi:NAD(P)-dependent dehydrogenase (short-subunit alcohol dehydrogenase family)
MAAQQLGRYNINVNAICPGVTRTELGARNAVTRAGERGVSVEQMQAEQEAQIPIRRANTPRRHRGDGAVPGLGRRAEHHRPVL